MTQKRKSFVNFKIQPQSLLKKYEVVRDSVGFGGGDLRK